MDTNPLLLSPAKQILYHELLTEEWQSTRELTLKEDPNAFANPFPYHRTRVLYKHLRSLHEAGVIERQKTVRYTDIQGARQLRACNIWRRPHD